MLSRYPPEEIAPALVHRNGQVRRYAAMLLGIGRDERLVPFLTDLLQSGSPPVRRVAAQALGIPARPFSDPAWLGRSGPAAVDRLAVESLTEALRDPDDRVRANSARSLGNLRRSANAAAQPSDETALTLLRSDAVLLPLTHSLLDPVSEVKVAVAAALREFSAPAALPLLLPLLQDPEEEVRVAAAVTAGQLGAPQSLPILLEALRHGPSHRRPQAAASLRALGDAAAVPALMDALADPSGSVQREAAIALGHLGDLRAVPALIDALGATNIMAEERRGLRENLVNALGRLGDRRAVPALIRALNDYDKHVRNAALTSLAELGGSQAEGALIDLVDRNIFHARLDISARVAIRSLGRMGVVRAMPTLRLAMEEGQPELAPVAARALRQLGDTITGGDVLAWLSSTNSDRRLRAVLTLPALVDRDALPHLLSALGDSDAAVRAAAARQLGRLDDGSAIPILTEALQGEGEVEEVREAIRGALASLAKGPRRHSAAPEAC